MSASAWDRAVEAAAEANGQTEPLAARYRESIEQALAAALPVLLEELTQRIEGGAEGLARMAREAVEDGDKGLARHASIKAEGVRRALGTVRGFAAEVTQ